MCNREISSRRIDWSFPRSSTTIRADRQGRVVPTPPPAPLTVRVMRNALTGRGIRAWHLRDVSQGSEMKTSLDHIRQQYYNSGVSVSPNWPVARRGNLSFYESREFSKISGLCHLKVIDWLHIKIYTYSSISFPRTVNKTCPCGVTVISSHHKVITSSTLLQGYYIKVYQGYYVTARLTNHRPFQNRPTLDAKTCIFARRRLVRVGYSESARWKLSF